MFPSRCRLCQEFLTEFSRIPVCASCVNSVQALQARCLCEQCGRVLASERAADSRVPRCGFCRREMTQFDRGRSFGRYDGALRALIHLFKYGGVRRLAPRFGEYLIQVVTNNPDYLLSDVVVPVPLHPERESIRGYNQAELLAHELARRTGLRVERDSFARVKATRPQAGLTAHQRRENVRAAFAVRGDSFSGLRVILVDDVLTTGATLNSCAFALRRVGASEVRVLTVARVVRE